MINLDLYFCDEIFKKCTYFLDFQLELINSFMSLFYVAFYLRDMVLLRSVSTHYIEFLLLEYYYGPGQLTLVFVGVNCHRYKLFIGWWFCSFPTINPARFASVKIVPYQALMSGCSCCAA